MASPAGLEGSKSRLVHCSLNPANPVEVEMSSYMQRHSPAVVLGAVVPVRLVVGGDVVAGAEVDAAAIPARAP
jgi:hypothetical protein